MQTYILSVLSKENIELQRCEKIKDELSQLYTDLDIEYQQYEYNDMLYKELDFDIKGIVFHKEDIDNEIQKLIKAISLIFKNIDISCEIIGGYNDTENAIQLYEKDRLGNYNKFSLFGTRDIIPDGKPYYADEYFTVYQSFEYDSLGVIF
jgi:hypothetical protein